MRGRPLALLLILCTACGVGPTGVVGAGEPARGFTQGTRLYFVLQGELASAGRPEGPLNAAEAVELLRDGPTAKERERELGTLLPKNLSVRVTDDGFTLDKGMPMLVGGKWLPPVSRLPRLATGQLVCTIAEATAAKRGLPVAAVRVTVPEKGAVGCDDYR